MDNTCGLPFSTQVVSAAHTLSMRTDRPITLRALAIAAGRGQLVGLDAATHSFFWSQESGTKGVPLSIFGPLSAMSSWNDGRFVLNEAQNVSLSVVLDVGAKLGAIWASDDASKDEQAMALAAAQQQKPPGHINWLFGLGEVSVPAGGTATLRNLAARPAGQLGELVLDVDGVVPVGDLVVTDVKIANKTQLPAKGEFDASLLDASQFGRGGVFIPNAVGPSSPVEVELRNYSAGAIKVMGGFIANPWGLRVTGGMPMRLGA